MESELDKSLKTEEAKDYSAGNIQVLKGLEAVRKKTRYVYWFHRYRWTTSFSI